MPTPPETEQESTVAEFDDGNVVLVVDETERLAGMIIMAGPDTDVTEACEDARAELVRRHSAAEFGSEPAYVDGHEVFTATWLWSVRRQTGRKVNPAPEGQQPQPRQGRTGMSDPNVNMDPDGM